MKKSLIDIIKSFCKKSHITYTTITLLNNDNVLFGAVQSISYNKRKDSHINVNCVRVRIDKSRVTDLFLKEFVIPTAQKMPFHIEVDDGDDVYRIENCWVTSTSYSYSSNEYIIIDDLCLEAETIFKKQSQTFQ